MTRFNVVIPARYASTRLPGKPLITIGDALLVEHVYRAAAASGAQEVIVATDDQRVVDACNARDMVVAMTSDAHRSGTDRCAEVAQQRGWPDDATVVNVQGDEPLVPPAAIAQVANVLGQSDLATLATPMRSERDYHDPNRVKVVCDKSGRALLFSRSPIPYCRDGQAVDGEPFAHALHHIGLYAYRVSTLRTLTRLPACQLEQIESLEQLRALYHGLSLQVGLVQNAIGPGVDTPQDVEEVSALLSRQCQSRTSS
ncbi:MAG: 3-deoxy-manno-octulosonate cytidylyltransferase [Gammaproteobacteria bacterium]